MAVCNSTHEIYTSPELLSHRHKDIIFIIDDLLEEGQELFSGPFWAKRCGNRPELLHGIYPQLQVIVPKLINEDGHGVERGVHSTRNAHLA
mmetsp:Transcript_28324/g.46599  ORF Transcript_28324/g.46599 Transcript_28324/m.46599 type:complete len:91 (+) Transcript_28324:1555-1827(+)